VRCCSVVEACSRFLHLALGARAIGPSFDRSHAIRLEVLVDREEVRDLLAQQLRDVGEATNGADAR
jgi:hypothetical protein